MAARSLIIFTISLYCFCLTVEGRVVSLSADEETFRPFCSRMCNSSKGPKDSLLPPYECSCSKSCAVYGDCCYDSPYKNTKRRSQFHFVCLAVHGRGQFQAVSSCPPHIRSDSCTQLLGHLPPVTSRVTNITYGNLFCASCNEDDGNLVRWNVNLRCTVESDWQDFSKIAQNLDKFWARYALERIWRSCQFHVDGGDFSVLNGLELRSCDLPEKVSVCSVRWKDYSVQKKCSSYEDPVYVGSTLYRNSHCAECNFQDLDHADCIPYYVREMLEEGRIDEDYIRACMAASPFSCLHNLGRGILHSIANMFDPQHAVVDISETGCMPPSGKLCCDGERIDYMTGLCRKTRKG